MRFFFTLACLCTAILLGAKGIKLNTKAEIKPYSITIEKVETSNGRTNVYGKIKQQKRFSYSIDFADCSVITSVNPDGIKGQLTGWNDDKKIPFSIKPISDKKEEAFVLSFPEDAIPQTGLFDLKIGTEQNKDKTEIIVTDLSLEKKK